MAISIEKILLVHGPSLSSDLKDILVNQYGLSPAAARQKISRASGDVYKLKNLPFPRNATFVYLKSQYGSPDYWTALHESLLKTKSAYGLAISALTARQGMMPYEHFKIACGAPLRQKRHLSPDQIKKRLLDAGIVRTMTFNSREVLYLVRDENHKELRLSELQGRLLAESMLLKGLYSWCRNLGLASFNQLKIRDKGELPVISTTAWDLAGPSYLSGITSFKKGSDEIKSGFIAIDILLNYIVSEHDIAPYLKKLNSLKQLKNVGSSIHFFVAFEYTAEAFNLLKKSGVSAATVKNLFGVDIAEGLSNLIYTLTVAANTIDSPEKINELFDKLGKLEGASSLVRGALFEFLVAEVIRSTTQPVTVELNKIVRTSDAKQAEIDVFSPQHTNNEVIFAECKGLNPNATLSDEEVDKWLFTRISTIRKYCLEHPDLQNKQLIFQLWTTANLSSESFEKIKKAADATKKYSIQLIDKKSIAEKLRSHSLKQLSETYRVHFLSLPKVG
ncbi:hypothetical protein [Idiomarina seosinensis]|uniref:Uncharacterized protein n=1 Tax=Idiomarina seosinensis TaxID=281739 RepID=A0A432ZIN5_9GAMM|nr:hypothetical protein [Idiomarina seosinensis]RUO77885.1 hypothetical protein CWI81_05230 [Idiomarina seosinensis]